jgi:hypothetical protein
MQTIDPERSLRLRRSTGIPALLNVKTACSRRGIVPFNRQPSHRERYMPVAIGRRELIAALGSAAAWPLAARAQQAGKIARIGFLGPSRDSPPPIAYYQAFLARLRALGFSEGENLRVEYRALNDPRGPFVAAAELVRSQPDLIVVEGPELSLQAVVGASGFIPIVMMAVNYDPVAHGYVESLARPGGNITGVIFRQLELAAKQVELLTQAFPEKRRLAALFDAQTADQLGEAEKTATLLNVQFQALKLENPPYDFTLAFRSAALRSPARVLKISKAFRCDHPFQSPPTAYPQSPALDARTWQNGAFSHDYSIPSPGGRACTASGENALIARSAVSPLILRNSP